MGRWVGVLALTLAGCGASSAQLEGQPPATGADAQVTADYKEDQGLTALDIQAEHLAPPARISQSATSYVAWVRGADATEYRRLGSLDYDPDSRKGTLNASAPMENFELLITAEAAPDAQQPSAQYAVFRRSIRGE